MKYCSASFKQLLIVLSIVFLGACGGSGSSSGSGSESATASKPAPKSVAGTAVKGVIANGLVQAFAVSNGAVGDLLASSTTDNQGHYSLTVPGEYLGPVLIEISARSDATTLMTCDAAGGCGNFTGISEHDTNDNGTIDFGEKHVLNNQFMLQALVPNNNLSQAGHLDVTLLTHLAASYAASFPQGYDNLSAELAISQIANLFELSENPFSLNAPDLTSPEDFAAASDQERLYALISSSIASLAESDQLATTIETLANAFTNNTGQLVTRSSNASDITLERILQAGLSNLTRVQESQQDDSTSAALSGQLTAQLNEAQTADEGSLTSAEGSPTSGSSELEKTRAFIADLQAWQGVIHVTDMNQPLVTDAYDLATGMDHYQSPLLQALALSSQHAAIVAVPDLALEAACNSLGNMFAKLLCQSLIIKYSIEEMCDVALNLTIFGVSVCDFLNDLTLPMGHGLWANYAIYDGNARIFGELEGVELDVSFTNGTRSGKTIRFDIEGTVSDSVSQLVIAPSTVTFRFDSNLTSQTLKLPEQVDLQLNHTSDTTTDTESFSFDGTITATVMLAEVTGSGQLGKNGVPYTIATDGDYSYGQSLFGGTSNLNNRASQSITTAYDITNQDMTVSATLSLQSLSDFTVAWSGKRYRFAYGAAEESTLTISNQDNVSLQIDYSAPNQASAGRLTIGSANYAEVTWLNDSLEFRLPDNSETILY